MPIMAAAAIRSCNRKQISMAQLHEENQQHLIAFTPRIALENTTTKDEITDIKLK